MQLEHAQLEQATPTQPVSVALSHGTAAATILDAQHAAPSLPQPASLHTPHEASQHVAVRSCQPTVPAGHSAGRLPGCSQLARLAPSNVTTVGEADATGGATPSPCGLIAAG